MESLFDIWGRRNPEWEVRYQTTIMDVFCDYGKGTTSLSSARSKPFGAGYEIFILAFFIGLYYDKTKPLVEDKAKKKSFGWAIQNWGNIENRGGRIAYDKLQKFIFAALIARTDVDFIALDKGEINVRKAVDQLIDKMEQYANFGFSFMTEKMEENPNYFFNETAFLRLFTSFSEKGNVSNNEDDEIEDL
uniref:glycoside hydrolase family 15 n=1 Tax=Alloprevotella sp. TaxID=1872471 RepID=UPI004024E4EF